MPMSPKAYAEALLADARLTQFVLENPEYKQVIDQSMKNLHANKKKDFLAKQGVMELKGYKINPKFEDKVNAFLNSEAIPFEKVAKQNLKQNYLQFQKLAHEHPEILEDNKPKVKVIPKFFEPEVMKFMAHSMVAREMSLEERCNYWNKAYEFYDDYFDHDMPTVEMTLSNSFMGLYEQYQQLCGE